MTLVLLSSALTQHTNWYNRTLDLTVSFIAQVLDNVRSYCFLFLLRAQHQICQWLMTLVLLSFTFTQHTTVRGDAKIFDFGLAKELLPRDRVGPGEYKASGLTGSRRCKCLVDCFVGYCV